MPTVGDVKPGFQSADHDGWYTLNGRNINTLASTPRNNAVSIGFLSVLPNASDASLMSSVNNLKQVVGSNEISISQQHLPKITFTHSHKMFANIQTSPSNNISADAPGYSDNTPYFAHLTNAEPANYVIKTGSSPGATLGRTGTETTELNPSPTQSVIDIRGKYLGVNFFVWLDT